MGTDSDDTYDCRFTNANPDDNTSSVSIRLYSRWNYAQSRVTSALGLVRTSRRAQICVAMTIVAALAAIVLPLVVHRVQNDGPVHEKHASDNTVKVTAELTLNALDYNIDLQDNTSWPSFILHKHLIQQVAHFLELSLDRQSSALIELVGFRNNSGAVAATLTCYFPSEAATGDYGALPFARRLVEMVRLKVEKEGKFFGDYPIDALNLELISVELQLRLNESTHVRKIHPATSSDFTAEVLSMDNVLDEYRRHDVWCKGCCADVVEPCQQHVPYSRTSRQLLSQQLIYYGWIAAMLNKTSGCYDQAAYFLCASMAPPCSLDDGTAQQEEPSPILSNALVSDEIEMPCRFLCVEFWDRCISAVESMTLEYDIEELLSCNVEDLDPPENETHLTPPSCFAPGTILDAAVYGPRKCIQFNHSMCWNMGFTETLLPNSYGHRTESEVRTFIDALPADVLHLPDECSALARRLACASLLSPCTAPANDADVLTPSCWSACYGGFARCPALFKRLPIEIVYSCERAGKQPCNLNGSIPGI